MTDLDQLRDDLLAAVAAAAGLDALDAVRVHALGKQGAVTGLLKTLGAMSPEERQREGPRIHGLREAVTEAIASRKEALESADMERRLATERLDMTLPAGMHAIKVRAINSIGQSQPGEPLWNPAGYMRNVVETTRVQAA